VARAPSGDVMPVKSVAEAIREATAQLLESDPNVYVIGEGVTDRRHAFGTVPEHSRVYDMPVAENGVTGVCIGTAIAGMRPILVHMRADFLLYSMDQLVNNAAKWYAMFGGQRSVLMVVRAISGRGWGNGYQHTQRLEQLFDLIEGLTVICPSNAYDAKGMLIWATRNPNPILFMEHRWCHELKCEVPDEMYEVVPQPVKLTEGKQKITTYGYLVHEALHASKYTSLEIWDMRGPRGATFVEKSNCPPSLTLSKNFYPTAADLGAPPSNALHDIPNPDFRGPF
jgi:acetoin:2,6-dichlorophenolindophenol oxidoreductase subunit beta